MPKIKLFFLKYSFPFDIYVSKIASQNKKPNPLELAAVNSYSLACLIPNKDAMKPSPKLITTPIIRYIISLKSNANFIFCNIDVRKYKAITKKNDACTNGDNIKKKYFVDLDELNQPIKKNAIAKPCLICMIKFLITLGNAKIINKIQKYRKLFLNSKKETVNELTKIIVRKVFCGYKKEDKTILIINHTGSLKNNAKILSSKYLPTIINEFSA